MSTYAIGDIQGCSKEFFKLLDKIAFSPKHDQLWIAGDIVNRGPDNLTVLRYLKELGDKAICVLGNHDLHLLAVAAGIKRPNPKDTIDDILTAPDADELLHWVRSRPLLHKHQQIVMTHAGVPAIWSVKEARAYAKEVEQVLQSTLYIEFFRHMYGNTPSKWSPRLTGWDRLRIITNYFTRMRFCQADGTLDLSAKAGVETAPKGFAPWFTFPRKSKKTFLFGHWAALMGETGYPKAVALDTGCVWGMQLTALRLDDWQYFHVNSQQI